jgi:outer membrane protein assembly factor BamC
MHPNSTRPLPSFARLGVIALAVAMVAGCSVLQEDKVDYKSAKRGSTLEVPPDLTQLSRDARYQVPGNVVTASGYQAAQPAATDGSSTAANRVGDVRIERAGNQRWLVVDRPAEKLWGPVRDFWQENGFNLERNDEKLGIMETDWAENRAKLPQDFIRQTLGKLVDGAYSTGEMDRFRTRLERGGAEKTEIYISHRGMIEVYSNEQKDQTKWQPRPSDTELESEFLRRLMVKLGVSEAQAKAELAAVPAQAAARVVTVNNQPAIQLDDGFDLAWRRVGLSLDRTGFTVEDRDRGQGTYFVRYVTPGKGGDGKPGFFGRLFSSSTPETKPTQYRVMVRSSENRSTVSVLDSQGTPETAENAQRILKILADDLK